MKVEMSHHPLACMFYPKAWLGGKKERWHLVIVLKRKGSDDEKKWQHRHRISDGSNLRLVLKMFQSRQQRKKKKLEKEYERGSTRLSVKGEWREAKGTKSEKRGP